MKKTVVVTAISVALLGGCSDEADNESTEAATPLETVEPSPSVETSTEPEQTTVEEEPEVEPQAAEEPPFPIYELGERFEFEDSALTIEKVEVSDTIETNEGGPLVAEDGELLVLVSMRYENLGRSGVDLSCSGLNDLYFTAYDSEMREMAPLFETNRIPGNQECNEDLLSGQSADWNEAYRMVEDGEPMAFEIAATSDFDNIVVANLSDDELTVTFDEP